MVPVIAKNGSSFKGAALYYLHDKDALSNDRVAWTHTDNMMTKDPEKAFNLMAFTAMHQDELKRKSGVKSTGRKLQKPVFSFSLAWHPEQSPDKNHMLETAKSAVESLGLSKHQAVYVAHNDEPQKHVHVIINRVDFETGKAASLSRSKTRLSEWAREYEKTHGKIYCQQREENAQKREQGSGKKYCDPVIEQAWKYSDNGKTFVAALKEQGYHLAQGNKRIIVVDPWGKTQNPVRSLEGVKAKTFRDRLNDIDLNQLPNADRLQKEIRTQIRKHYHASRKYDLWAGRVLNETQDRHLNEHAKLNNKFRDRKFQKQTELEDFYKTKSLQNEIKSLEKRTSQKQSLWRLLSGKTSSDLEQLAALKLQMEDIDRRTQEQIKTIEKQKEEALKQQEARQKDEMKRARELVENKRPDFYREELESLQEQSKDKSQDRGQSRERERDFRF